MAAMSLMKLSFLLVTTFAAQDDGDSSNKAPNRWLLSGCLVWTPCGSCICGTRTLAANEATVPPLKKRDPPDTDDPTVPLPEHDSSGRTANSNSGRSGESETETSITTEASRPMSEFRDEVLENKDLTRFILDFVGPQGRYQMRLYNNTFNELYEKMKTPLTTFLTTQHHSEECASNEKTQRVIRMDLHDLPEHLRVFFPPNSPNQRFTLKNRCGPPQMGYNGAPYDPQNGRWLIYKFELDLSEVKGYAVKISTYTVPAQPKPYNGMFGRSSFGDFRNNACIFDDHNPVWSNLVKLNEAEHIQTLKLTTFEEPNERTFGNSWKVELLDDKHKARCLGKVNGQLKIRTQLFGCNCERRDECSVM